MRSREIKRFDVENDKDHKARTLLDPRITDIMKIPAPGYAVIMVLLTPTDYSIKLYKIVKRVELYSTANKPALWRTMQY